MKTKRATLIKIKEQLIRNSLLEGEEYEGDYGYCAKCRKYTLVELDHKIPLFKGGSNSWDNLQILCIDCHREKTTAERNQWQGSHKT